MPMNTFTMWGMLALMTFGAVAGALIHGHVLASIRAAYPADPARRYALRRCGETDAGFSRFSEGDRDACYRAMRPARASSNDPVQW